MLVSGSLCLYLDVWVSALHKVNFLLLCLSAARNACGAAPGLQKQHPLCLQALSRSAACHFGELLT